MSDTEILVSVLLPIYKEPLIWIKASVNSILNQTFRFFELLLLLDNPEHEEAIEYLSLLSKQDNRIILIINQQNQGLPLNLNQGIALSKGKYIARMDADDIAFSYRLEEQFNFMEKNTDIDLCGSQVIKIDENNRKIGYSKSPTKAKAIAYCIQYINPLTHITWFIKRETLLKLGGYYNMPNAEDYELLTRIIAHHHKVVNLDKPLIYMRVHTKGQTGAKSLEQKICFKYIHKKLRECRNSQVWNYDETMLRQMISNGLLYSQQQNRAQHYLVNALQASGKHKILEKYYFLFLSYWVSPIQRAYYHDLLKARIIAMWYA